MPTSWEVAGDQLYWTETSGFHGWLGEKSQRGLLWGALSTCTYKVDIFVCLFTLQGSRNMPKSHFLFSSNQRSTVTTCIISLFHSQILWGASLQNGNRTIDTLVLVLAHCLYTRMYSMLSISWCKLLLTKKVWSVARKYYILMACACTFPIACYIEVLLNVWTAL